MRKFFIIILLLLLSSCKKNDDIPVSIPVEEKKETNIPEKEPEKEILEEVPNESLSFLTGNYIDKEIANERPKAIVINNLKKAIPQSGISQADMFYEVLAEGGITRIIALFQEGISEKVGPVRSARHYFLDFALDNDAIFVHHGNSQQALNFMIDNKIDRLDGMVDGSVFWRDQERANQRGLEHSSYTNTEKIKEGITNKSIKENHDENFSSMFSFFDEEVDLEEATNLEKIIIPYSHYQTTVFEYDSEKRDYKRFQNDSPHMDEENNEQIVVKNVIIQCAEMFVIDAEGRLDVKLVGEGRGYYFSNGKYIKINWKKDSHNSKTIWTLESGEPLFINKGKTFICVYDKTKSLELELKEN